MTSPADAPHVERFHVWQVANPEHQQKPLDVQIAQFVFFSDLSLWNRTIRQLSVAHPDIPFLSRIQELGPGIVSHVYTPHKEAPLVNRILLLQAAPIVLQRLVWDLLFPNYMEVLDIAPQYLVILIDTLYQERDRQNDPNRPSFSREYPLTTHGFCLQMEKYGIWESQGSTQGSQRARWEFPN